MEESLYGLVGYPLEHSFSMRYFSGKFRKEGIPAVYRNFPLENIGDLHHLLEDNPSLRGFNVTSPYKERIIPFLSSLSYEAREIGAVNCIGVCQGKLYGYNTDIHGFETALRSFIGNRKMKALILGTGGAAKAAALVLGRKGIDYQLVSRTGWQGSVLYGSLSKEVLDASELIINATPVGTWPETETYPDIPYQYLTEHHYLFDMVYNPEQTSFLSMGQKKGCKTMNGLGMLEAQAEESWRIWND